MKRFSILIGACAIIAACGEGASSGGSPEASCTAMVAGDPDVEQEFARDSYDVATFCGCYASALNQQPDDDKAAILKVTQAIADIREARKIGVEAAADLIGNDAGGATYGVTRGEFTATGQFLDEVGDQIKRSGGSCSLDAAG